MATSDIMLGPIYHANVPVRCISSDSTVLVDSTNTTAYTDNIDTLDNSDSSSLTDSNDPSILVDGSDTSTLTDCSDASVLVDSSDKPVYVETSSDTSAPVDSSYTLALVYSSDISAHVDVYMYTEPLIGLPACITVDGVRVEFSSYIPARRAAITYCLSVGISPNSLPRTYARVDKNKARRIARLYDELQPTPHDELTQASYRALADETLAQWRVIKATGLQVEYNPTMTGAPDPYSNPRRLILDVKQNNHLFVTATRSAYGSMSFELDPLNPLLDEVPDERISGEVPLVNDILRIVHDYFGHTREGLGFRSEGEYNAWRGHLAMYSPLAGRAMTMEMWVQNCWINYGPFGASNRYASMEETKFPQQKLGLLPEWVF